MPAFSTLDRLSRRVRTLINSRLFAAVHERLSHAEREQLDALLEIGSNPQKKTLFFALKQLPKRSSLTHLQDLLDHFVTLANTVGANHHLTDISFAKVKHFAAEAKALDAAELKKFTPAKRYVLILCMNHLRRRGKDELEPQRPQYRQKTDSLVAALADVIGVLGTEPTDEAAGKTIRSLLSNQGGIQALQDDCAAISAFRGDNYFPLLWRFYRSHRSALFRRVNLLTMASTSEDRSLIQALAVLLKYEHRKGAWIEEPVDFSFTNERWKRTVLKKTDDGERIIRQHFEVCVFSALATELKSGDISIQGSLHILSFINRRHANANKLNPALRDIINRYHAFDLPKVWGDGKSVAADGTQFDMYDQNLLAEYHIRYGGYGGIAYHHVADNGNGA